MATLLVPTPLKRSSRHREDLRGRVRAAFGAGLAAAITAAIVLAPNPAHAQDTTLTDANAWAIEQVQAPAAWETTQGEGITVAVLDTGIGPHPFFDDKDILPGYSASPDEEDGHGDKDGHGSQVIASVLYVAPEATIMPVRISTGAEGIGGGTGPAHYDAMRWAVDNGANVLVMPWGVEGAGPDEGFLEAIQYAIDMGAVVIAAAGNDRDIDVTYPASIAGVVAVSGTDTSGNAWFGNTTGPEVVVAAPADDMLHPRPQVTTLSDSELYSEGVAGTSGASGMVGGIAALTFAAHPDIDASNVVQRIIQTAGDGSGSNRTEETGFGLVNAEQAVNAEGIETVEENPLGYPMGEPGASGAGSDEDAEDGGESEPSSSAGEGSVAAEESSEDDSNLSTILVIAAAAVLIGAAVVVWLVLRGRGRNQGGPNAGPPGSTSHDGSAMQGGHPPSNYAQQGFPPPGAQGHGYGAPPSGDQPTYSPPPGTNEPSPPWGPSNPNRQP